MTLPVAPDVETILDSCIETLRDVVAPNVDGEWPRYSAELGRALDEVREIVAADAADYPDLAPEWSQALAAESPFEAASGLLVACQNSGGELAERVRGILHPVLRAQLDAEMGRTTGLFAAFARNMVGAR